MFSFIYIPAIFHDWPWFDRSRGVGLVVLERRLVTFPAVSHLTQTSSVDVMTESGYGYLVPRHLL